MKIGTGVGVGVAVRVRCGRVTINGTGFRPKDHLGQLALWAIGLVLDVVLVDDLASNGSAIVLSTPGPLPLNCALHGAPGAVQVRNQNGNITLAILGTLKQRGIPWIHSLYHIGDRQQVQDLRFGCPPPCAWMIASGILPVQGNRCTTTKQCITRAPVQNNFRPLTFHTRKS